MNSKHTVRIGVKSARELEIEVEDPVAVSAAYEKALKGKDSVLWITDTDDHRFGISIDSVAFIEIEPPQDRGVGFSK
jgi:hypothetical protein